VFLDFYVAALCNLRFTICGSCMEQVWPLLEYSITSDLNVLMHTKKNSEAMTLLLQWARLQGQQLGLIINQVSLYV